MNMGMNVLKGAVAAVLLGTGFAAAATPVAQVERNVPGMVAHATRIGPHNPSAMLDITLALEWRNLDQLRSLAHDVNTRGNPLFHKFLNNQEFNQRFAPSPDQVASVTKFLQQNGLKVTGVSASQMLVSARASTAAIQNAFGVSIADFKSDGVTFYSATGNPNIPANLSSLVVAVMGLDNAVVLQPHSIKSPVQPKGGGLGKVGFSPQQIATAYNWPGVADAGGPLTDTTQASGVTIAIATAFSFRMADLVKFWDTYQLPHHNVSIVSIGGVSRELNGETTLDIERSSSMSPGSDIIVYESSTPKFTTFEVMFDRIVSDNIADVVSTSWGAPEKNSDDSDYTPASHIKAEDDTFLAGIIKGMTFVSAAGDNGAADGRPNQTDDADFPTSDPNVVAAGGTSLFLDDNNSITEEDAWSGAGGADSVYFKEPAYQTNTAGWVSNTSCGEDPAHAGQVRAANANIDAETACANISDASRQTSDLSMNADPATGYTIYFNGRWETFGGTSFVAPELAGLFAVVTARVRTLTANNVSPVNRLGLVQNAIYSAGANNSSDFNDITTGSNGFPAAAGWDHPTGWGTPHDADALANDLAAFYNP